MKFKFWGTRGSIPVPGEKTIKYGGNTTCIEVRTNNNDLIILDAGTGIHALSQDLLQCMPIKAHILITHTHWDHIQGLPFCAQLYIPGNEFIIYGAKDRTTGEDINRALDVQHQHSYFPIPVSNFKAKVSYKNVNEGTKFFIEDATISPILLTHPVVNLGYRIDCDGQSLFFTGDFEPPYNIYSFGEQGYDILQAEIDIRMNEIASLIQGVDALIIDSSFTAEEFKQKIEWGHGSYETAIDLAKRAKVKKLFLTHHEPTRTDADLDQIYIDLLENHPDLDFELHIAQEQIEITL